MTWGKVAPPAALVELSEVVAEADGPLPPARVLPLLRELATQIGDGPADSFGFATVAYHALTGTDPFPEGGGRTQPVGELLPSIPRPAAEALMQALSPDRSARPAPASVLAALDDAWPEEEPEREAAPAEPTAEQSEDRLGSKAAFHQAMRDLVAPPRPVPQLGSLDTEGALPEATFDPERPNRVRRRRRSGGRRRSSDRR